MIFKRKVPAVPLDYGEEFRAGLYEGEKMEEVTSQATVTVEIEPEQEVRTVESADDIVANASSGEQAVIEAWCNPGPGRALHYKAMRELYENWPTLALSIQRLVSERLVKDTSES